MDKYCWKLLKAIFFICSSTCSILVAFIVNTDDTVLLGVIGIIGMVIGLVMGWSTLIGHYLDDSQKKKK